MTSVIPFSSAAGIRRLSVLSLSANKPKIIQCTVKVSGRFLNSEDWLGHRPAKNIHYDLDIRCESSLAAGDLRNILSQSISGFKCLPQLEFPVQGHIVSWHVRVQHGKQRYRLAGSQLYPSFCIMAYLSGDNRGREQLRKAGFSSVSCDFNYAFTTSGDTLKVLHAMQDDGYEPFGVEMPNGVIPVPSLPLAKVDDSCAADVQIVLMNQLLSFFDDKLTINMTAWDVGDDLVLLRENKFRTSESRTFDMHGVFNAGRDEDLAWGMVKFLRGTYTQEE